MGIQVTWDNEDKTIIRYDFVGDWTWTEFRIAAREASRMTASVTHPVDTIFDFTSITTLPSNALFEFRRVMDNPPENRGIDVIVGTSDFVKTLVAVFSRVYSQLGQKMLLVDTLDEARATLHSRRSKSYPGV